MSTPAQIAANRRNAKKSTGPRTPEGRNRTRLNALQHGITRQVTIMTDDERPGFMQYCAEIVQDFAPANAHERRLAQAIAEDYWRLDRSRAAEHNLFAMGVAEAFSEDESYATDTAATLIADDPGANDAAENDPSDPDPRIETAFTHVRVALDHCQKLNLLSLYEQRLNRTLHKNLALLRQLQAERKAEEHDALEHALRLHQAGVEAPRIRAVAFDPSRQINEAQSLVLDGLVFSNHELEHERDRRDRYRNPRPTRRGPSESLRSAA